jgi:hypothetical protein
MSTTAVTRPKDVDNVLLRLPASVKARAKSIAHDSHVSQNAFYSAAVLHWTLVHGEIPEIGSPENVRALVTAIDGSHEDGFPIMGAFHKNDWNQLTGFVTMLADSEIICDLRTKPDARSTETIVYTFQLTKVGHMMWPAFSSAILSKLSKSSQESLFPSP